MTGILTAAAIFFVLSLMASAAATIGQATAAVPNKRGRWGMLTRTSQRNRPLNPQERRWQTALLAGKDNESRWKDVVVELETLQRLNSITPSESAPTSYNARWVEQTIAELEASIDAKTIDAKTTEPKTTIDTKTEDET